MAPAAGCHLWAMTMEGWVGGTVRQFFPDLERIELARRPRRPGPPSGADDLTGGRQTFHLQDHHWHRALLAERLGVVVAPSHPGAVMQEAPPSAAG
jgi:hypothetical protein